jgi:hypothetical protein
VSHPFSGEPAAEDKAVIDCYIRAFHQLQIAEREQILHWAPLFCSCPAWRVRAAHPPQADCMVHGTVLLKPEGGWL